MYRNHGQPSVVNGQRISYGNVIRDQAKQTRLAGIIERITPLVESLATQDIAISDAEKYRHKQCHAKCGLPKQRAAPYSLKPTNYGDGGRSKLQQDLLKSIGITDGSSAVSVKQRKRSYDTFNNNNNNASSDEIVAFKLKMAQKEAELKLKAKRRKVASALPKQNDTADENTDVYACTKVKSAKGLKLRLTKVSAGANNLSSSRKRKRQC